MKALNSTHEEANTMTIDAGSGDESAHSQVDVKEMRKARTRKKRSTAAASEADEVPDDSIPEEAEVEPPEPFEFVEDVDDDEVSDWDL